jgi:hypothetical protein
MKIKFRTRSKNIWTSLAQPIEASASKRSALFLIYCECARDCIWIYAL